MLSVFIFVSTCFEIRRVWLEIKLKKAGLKGAKAGKESIKKIINGVICSRCKSWVSASNLECPICKTKPLTPAFCGKCIKPLKPGHKSGFLYCGECNSIFSI